MTNKFNEKLLIWGLGVIQPATQNEVISFLKLIYPAVKQWPDDAQLQAIFDLWVSRIYIVKVSKSKLYSLALNANKFMGIELRKQRDKARLTLLRSVYTDSLKMSGDVVQDSDGVLPSSKGSTTIQEGSQPVSSGFKPSRTSSTRLKTRTNWLRVAEQLELQVGFDYHSSDIPSLQFTYYSFPTLVSLQQSTEGVVLEQDMTTSQLALAIGISPRLLTAIVHKKENHYRRFKIGKKGGGEREIASPRFFLKTIQYWLKSYILWQVKIHDSCHAYTKGRSIVTNANPHVRQKYVANIDIENFFGSITQEHVFNILRKNGVGEKLASIVARLTTLDDAVPQGAPTSPQISNGVLFDFDKAVSNVCIGKGVNYTRYADDITISGDDRTNLLQILDLCRKLLGELGFKLKESKTRIASYRACQKVTGLVVNEFVQPSREFRRNVRNMIYKAYQSPEEYVDKLDELRGYVSYMSSFESIKLTSQLNKAELAIAKVMVAKNNTNKVSSQTP